MLLREPLPDYAGIPEPVERYRSRSKRSLGMPAYGGVQDEGGGCYERLEVRRATEVDLSYLVFGIPGLIVLAMGVAILVRFLKTYSIPEAGDVR